MNKKWGILLALGMMALPAMAEDIATDAVLLQALDKTTGRTSFLTVKTNKPYEYGDLKVLVERCLKRPPEEAPENSVFMTLSEKATDDVVFRGWMFSSDPALSAMDHAVYDIWVVECIDSQMPKPKAIITTPVTIEQEMVAIEEIED